MVLQERCKSVAKQFFAVITCIVLQGHNTMIIVLQEHNSSIIVLQEHNTALSYQTFFTANFLYSISEFRLQHYFGNATLFISITSK